MKSSGPARVDPTPTPSGLEQAGPERIAELAWGYFGDRLPERESASKPVREWFQRLLDVFLPVLKLPAGHHLDQLPEKAAFIFGFDPDVARAKPGNRTVLAAESARMVLAEFAERARVHEGTVTREDFSAWIREIAAATGAGGNELLDPVRIALTGSLAGPRIDKLLSIVEDPAARDLGVPCVRERIERFVGV